MDNTDMVMFPQIRKEIPIPMYYQLKKNLLGLILDGTLKPGDMIPAEIELCERFGISRPTVRQALGELVSEGYLTRQKGKGTFVSKFKIIGKFFQIVERYSEDQLMEGKTSTSEVLEFRVADGVREVNARLGLGADDKLVYLRRLFFTEGKPFAFLETYLSHDRLGGLLNEDLTANSLLTLITEKFGYKVERVVREIEAVNSTAEEAKLLQITAGEAVSLVRSVIYANDDLPVDYTVARYRGDRKKFVIELRS